MLYRFGAFEADRGAYRATKQGVPLDLTPKLLDLLFYLLERPGQLVTKEELLDSVWPGANVTDNALAQAMSDLREAIDDDASAPTFIRTIARRGYRFIAPVERVAPGSEKAQLPSAVSATGAAEPGDRTLAVTDFANLSGDPEVAWLGAGIAETVTSDLTSLDAFRVIDRWRVVEAARRTSGSAADIGAAVGASHVVTGGFQRGGPQLRITARLIDVAKGDSVADVKVDGRVEDVFRLQDEIVRAFARELGLSTPPSASRVGVRETASLEAYRAYMEGWLKIESMDLMLNAAAIRDFERAIELDPKYAVAYTGLANAEFMAYESSRMAQQPNFAARRASIEHARYAVHLDAGLAEAHASLSFVLTSAFKFEEARVAAQQAVSIEPDNWRHQYRLGHALWGDARLRAFDRALALYPQFAYARYETAMVHVARGNFESALDIVQQAAADQDHQARAADRFPAVGFHWFLGAMRAVRDDTNGALTAFERELEQTDERRLYRTEYAVAAHVSRGHALLRLKQLERAEEAFTAALKVVPGHPRAMLGLAIASKRLGTSDAARRLDDARKSIANMRTPEREIEWLYASACEAAAEEKPQEAASALSRLLDALPPSHVGWLIPIEPALHTLHGHPAFLQVLERLAERAR